MGVKVRESELDDIQMRVLTSTLDKSCIVEGCAGSGKSALAMIKADRIRNQLNTNSYMVIVYTKALRQFMNAGEDFLNQTQNITYHWEWVNRMYRRPADYIIVDEVQDFEESDIRQFIEATHKNFFFFGDTAQSIYSNYRQTVTMQQLMMSCGNAKHFTLYNNYRLPLAIAKFVQYIGVDLEAFEESIYKSKVRTNSPYVIKCPDRGKQIELICKRIKERALGTVAVLLPNNDKVREVANMMMAQGINAEQKSKDDTDWRKSIENLNFNNTNPKVMTYHSAKGLQFDTVFMPFIEDAQADGDAQQRAIYVAMTRTMKDLYILYSGNMPGILTAIPENLYKTTDTTITEII